MKKFKQIFFSLTLPLLIIVALFGLISSTPAHARLDNPSTTTSTKWADRPMGEQVTIYQSYLALMRCFQGNKLKDGSFDDRNRISVDNANKFAWFGEPRLLPTGQATSYTVSSLGDNLLKNHKVNTFGIEIDAGSGFMCGEPTMIKKLLDNLGEDTSNAISLMCSSLGFGRDGGCGKDGRGEIYSLDKDKGPRYQLNLLKDRYATKFWGSGDPLSKAAQYYRYKTLFESCATPAANDNLSGTDRSYNIYTVDDTGQVSQSKTLYYGKDSVGKSKGEMIAMGGGGYTTSSNVADGLINNILTPVFGDGLGNVPTSISCADLESKLNDKTLLAAYAGYVQDKGTPPGISAGSSSGQNCNANTKADGCTEKPTCGNQVSGLGWILCPIIDGLTNLNDAVWGMVSGLLTVSPLRADGSESIYSAWGIMRSLANIAFIIVFLLMIFAQLTNFGISNYGVKKLLPRLLISALLVNLSFVIVQISVDLANILGTGLYDLLTNLDPNGVQPPSWNDLIGNILAGATGVGLGIGAIGLAGGIATAFWLLLPVAAMGALSLLAAIFTLVFRQAVIPVLAILAPLAFVAYMLPNTESWFKKWRDLMISMLMLYPLAAVLFGGAQFASTVIIGAGDSGNWWSTMLGLIVLTMPLFALPFLAKQGGPLLGKVGGALSNLAQKARNPINNYTKKRADMSRERYGAREMNTRARKMNLSRRMFQSAASREATVADRTEGYKKHALENRKSAMIGDPETGDPSGLKGGAKRARAAHDALDKQNLRGEKHDVILSRALEEKKATDPEFKRMVNTTKAQAQAKQTAIDRQTKNYATGLDTDPTLLRVAGGRTDVDPAGQIKAKAYGVQAEAELENKNVKAAQVLGGANSEAALQAGIRVSPDGTLGVVQSDGSLDTNIETVTQAMKNGRVIDGEGSIEDFSVAGIKSLGNLQEFYTTPFGAQAIASSLAATKQITAKGLVELSKNIENPEEKAQFVDQLNKELAAAGLDYLGKNSINAAGDIVIGGQKGNIPNVVKGILDDSGIGGYTKQMMGDPEFGPIASSLAYTMATNENTTNSFNEGLPKVSDKVLEQLADGFAKNDPEKRGNVYWEKELRTRRSTAIARMNGQSTPNTTPPADPTANPSVNPDIPPAPTTPEPPNSPPTS